jgi:hypothetical protein
MNETNQQIANVAKEAIEKILTLLETTQTPTETQDQETIERHRESVIDKAVDSILEDSSQIKDDIVDKVADSIDNSDISDSVYDRLDVDDIVSGVAERIDDDEVAQKVAENLDTDSTEFYRNLAKGLLEVIREEAKVSA